MIAAIADRVKESSTTTGTGALSLAGAVTGFRTFVAGIGAGVPCYYVAAHRTLDEWEIGIGAVTDGSPDTFARTTVIKSSNADALVSFTSGTKDVFVALPTAAIGRFVETDDARLAPPPPQAASGTFLKTGGAVVWLTGLQFSVGAGEGYVNGALVSWAQQNITLDAADGSNPRFDFIVIDATGTVQKITGTAAADPAIPSVDPELYLERRPVLVAAGATTPGTTATVLYDENDDWTLAASGGTIANSTSSPLAGSNSILGTAVANGHSFTLTKPAAGTTDLAAQDQLALKIKPTAAFPSNKALSLEWLQGGVVRGQRVALGPAHGFNKSSTLEQLVSVPVSAFGVPAGILVHALRGIVTGGGASVGFRIDDVRLLAGGVIAPVAIQFRFRGDWVSTAAYEANDHVERGGVRFIAIAPSTGQDPATAVAYWTAVGHVEETLMFAVSDEVTAITTGTAKITFRMPWPMTLRKVKASLKTASSSGTPTFDINEGGTTILSTKLTIDANEKTSETAAAAAVISDPNLAADAEMTVDIDAAGTGAVGAKIYLLGKRGAVL